MLSPDGRFLYLSYGDADETADSPPRVVTRFAVRLDGTLGPAQDVARVGPANFGIAISPDGGLVYVTSVGARSVWGFRRGADGSLAPVPGSPFAVPDPNGLKVTPDGRHLCVAAGDDISSPPGGLAGFTILADGSLTPTGDSPSPPPTPPRSRRSRSRRTAGTSSPTSGTPARWSRPRSDPAAH